MELVCCNFCNEYKIKIKTTKKKNRNTNFIYVNEFGIAWSGAKCPDCFRIAKAKYKRGRYQTIKKVNRSCLNCHKEFQTHHKKHSKYCSSACSQAFRRAIKFPKLLKEVDYSPRPHCKLYYRICEGCGDLFTTSHSNAKACQPSHTLKSKLSRKQRKYKKPISKFYKKELDLIYANKPLGMEVDHIIPLNGENVSGLHVPWNLQYLSPEANNKKSNKV